MSLSGTVTLLAIFITKRIHLAGGGQKLSLCINTRAARRE